MAHDAPNQERTPLDLAIADAETSVRQALGGATACTLHKDGRVTGGVKYAEGRLVALTEARRILRNGDSDGAGLAGLFSRWESEFETRRTSRVSSPPWIAYATGGLDGAREALDAVREHPDD